MASSPLLKRGAIFPAPLDDPDLVGKTLTAQVAINTNRLRALVVSVTQEPNDTTDVVRCKPGHIVKSKSQVGLHTHNLGRWHYYCSTCRRPFYVTDVIDPQEHPPKMRANLIKWSIIYDMLDDAAKNKEQQKQKPTKESKPPKSRRLSAAASYRPMVRSPSPTTSPMALSLPLPPPYAPQTWAPSPFRDSARMASSSSSQTSAGSPTSTSTPSPIKPGGLIPLLDAQYSRSLAPRGANFLSVVLWDGDRNSSLPVPRRDDGRFYLSDLKRGFDTIAFDLNRPIDVYVHATQHWHPWDPTRCYCVAKDELSIHFKYSANDVPLTFHHFYPRSIPANAPSSALDYSPSPPSSPLAGKGAVKRSRKEGEGHTTDKTRKTTKKAPSPFPFNPCDDVTSSSSMTTTPSRKKVKLADDVLELD